MRCFGCQTLTTLTTATVRRTIPRNCDVQRLCFTQAIAITGVSRREIDLEVRFSVPNLSVVPTTLKEVVARVVMTMLATPKSRPPHNASVVGTPFDPHLPPKTASLSEPRRRRTPHELNGLPRTGTSQPSRPSCAVRRRPLGRAAGGVRSRRCRYGGTKGGTSAAPRAGVVRLGRRAGRRLPFASDEQEIVGRKDEADPGGPSSRRGLRHESTEVSSQRRHG